MRKSRFTEEDAYRCPARPMPPYAYRRRLQSGRGSGAASASCQRCCYIMTCDKTATGC
jgi:hypothetical protein